MSEFTNTDLPILIVFCGLFFLMGACVATAAIDILARKVKKQAFMEGWDACMVYRDQIQGPIPTKQQEMF